MAWYPGDRPALGRRRCLDDRTYFLALVPKPRDGGIRTLAEAGRACSSLTKALDEQHRAGWADTSDPPGRRDTERSRPRAIWSVQKQGRPHQFEERGAVWNCRCRPALAICHHVVERPTPARLQGIKALGIGGSHDLDAMIQAQDTFLSLLLAQQLEDIAQDRPTSNAVAVKRLSSDERSRLRSALETVQHIDELKRDLLFRS